MNKDININGLDDETIKDIRSKLNENHSVSHDDIMESLMRRMGMDEQKPSTDTTNSDESETPNQQSVNKHIVKDVGKQHIPYPMSEVKRKQHKLKRKKLKKLNRK